MRTRNLTGDCHLKSGSQPLVIRDRLFMWFLGFIDTASGEGSLTHRN